MASGHLNQSEENPRNAKQEARGKGVNQTVFWVTHNIIGDWIQLPDSEPEHIIQSRFIKKLLTGNLNAPVDSYPPFPGKERNLLRALLARIQHTTHLCPKGTYEIDEETQEQKLTEEQPSLAVDDLKSLESWSHLYPIVLKAGRCTHSEPVGLTDEEKEEYMNKLNEEDKTEDRFKAVNEDTPVPGYESSWLTKVNGELQ